MSIHIIKIIFYYINNVPNLKIKINQSTAEQRNNLI